MHATYEHSQKLHRAFLNAIKTMRMFQERFDRFHCGNREQMIPRRIFANVNFELLNGYLPIILQI